MITMIVRHEVSDYNSWKRVYDEFAPVRKENGVTRASVYRNTNDPNNITVLHQFQDLDAATTFAESKELKTAMANAGVTGQPEIWFNNDIEQTSS
jgi:quinol monooxygenase YgiN